MVSKQEEESGGVDREFVRISRRGMDTLQEKAQLETALTTNSTTLMSKVLKDMNGEVRNLREEMAEMSLRVERLEREKCFSVVKNRRAVREEVNGLGGVALGG